MTLVFLVWLALSLFAAPELTTAKPLMCPEIKLALKEKNSFEPIIHPTIEYTTDGLQLSATIACNGTFVIGGDVELELNGAPIGMRGQNKIEIKCENEKWIHNHIELKNVGCFYRSM
ncbi:unnamed protein product [Caenorhabditis brenneri]